MATPAEPLHPCHRTLPRLHLRPRLRPPRRRRLLQSQGWPPPQGAGVIASSGSNVARPCLSAHLATCLAPESGHPQLTPLQHVSPESLWVAPHLQAPVALAVDPQAPAAALEARRSQQNGARGATGVLALSAAGPSAARAGIEAGSSGCSRPLTVLCHRRWTQESAIATISQTSELRSSERSLGGGGLRRPSTK